MPVHTNTIDNFHFLGMEGAPHLRQEELEIFERPGVDGSGVRKLGARGKPFEVRTTNYVASFTVAKELMDQYKALAGEDPVEWIRQSVSEGTFLVLAVRETARYAIFNALGGFDGGEEVCHEVTWVLLG